MLWKDAIKEVTEQRIEQIEKDTGQKKTRIAEESVLKRNFFTRLFNGDIERLDLDKELEPLAKILGFVDALDLLQHARQKKTEYSALNKN